MIALLVDYDLESLLIQLSTARTISKNLSKSMTKLAYEDYHCLS